MLERLPKDCEIIIVDGDDSSTLDLIQRTDAIKISSAKGRATQMNAGAKIAVGEYLLFLHADTLLPQNAATLVQKSLQCEDIVAGAFSFEFDSSSKVLKTIAKIANWRSRITKIPFGDQAIFIKKEIFEKIGGYEKIELMEDVALMRKLKREGLKIEILPQKVITSARKYEKNGIFYNVTRNWILLILYFLGTDPNKLARFY